MSDPVTELFEQHKKSQSVHYSVLKIQKLYRGFRARKIYKQEKECLLNSRPLIKWYGKGKLVQVKGYFENNKKCYLVRLRWCHVRHCFVSDILLNLKEVQNTIWFKFLVDGKEELDNDLHVLTDVDNKMFNYMQLDQPV